MTRRLFFIGLLATALPSAAGAAPILDVIERITAAETAIDGTELDVQIYLPLLLKDRLTVDLQEETVDLAVSDSEKLLCSFLGESQGNCLSTQEIARQAKRAAWNRTLARDLQLIAAGHEAGTVGYTGQDHPLTNGLPGVLNIWQSGVDEMTNPVLSPAAQGALPFDENLLAGMAQRVQQMLNSLLEEKYSKTSNRLQVAAVHRYRHGVNYVIDREGACASFQSATSDMENLTMRYCDLENILLDIHSTITSGSQAAPKAVYRSIQISAYDVHVWIRQDDVGFQWDVPLEPVLPTLVSPGQPTVIRLGGAYPVEFKEPTLDEGICSHPVGARGYLCRPVATSECPVTKGKPQIISGTGAGLSIVLTECLPYNYKSDQPIHTTDSGPDICTTGGWRFPLDQPDAAFADGPTLDAQCNTCIPDIRCVSSDAASSSSSARSRASSSESCLTGEYDTQTNKIKVCVAENAQLPAKYAMMQELVVAQQLCAKPYDQQPSSLLNYRKNTTDCCAVEWYPSLIACKAMAEDGKFLEQDITVLDCASALADHTCKALTGGTCSPPSSASSSSSSSGESEIFRKIVEAANQDDDTELSCTELIDEETPERRLASIVASFPVSCSPNCKAQYENTIGNNLCYIGQCVEQAMESGRLVPARLTFTSGDEAYPWDGCVAEDPQNGAYIELPPANVPFLPPYRGLELVRAADLAVCQVNGYPPLTPPILCLFSPARILALPTNDPNVQATGLQGQAEEQAIRSFLAQAESASLGVRAATSLYEKYIDHSFSGFGALIGVATNLIRQIGETSFPALMCPRYSVNGCAPFNTP